MDNDTAGREEQDCRCKVGSAIVQYGLEDANTRLREKWTGKSDKSQSVRELTVEFNRRLVRTAMQEAGMELVEGRVENAHRLLTDDDALEAVRLQMETTLQNDGVDVDALESAFVSHQTLYRHLTSCLDASKEINQRSIEKERQRVNRLQNRAEAVVTDSVQRLRDGGEVDIETFEVLVSFRVSCESCGRLHDADVLLTDGGCSCHR